MARFTPRPTRDSELGELRRLAQRRAVLTRLRMWLRRSMVPIPGLYIVLAIVLGLLTPAIDHAVGIRLQRGVGLSLPPRDLLTATAKTRDSGPSP